MPQPCQGRKHVSRECKRKFSCVVSLETVGAHPCVRPLQAVRFSGPPHGYAPTTSIRINFHLRSGHPSPGIRGTGRFCCAAPLDLVGACLCARPRAAGDGCSYGFYRECRGQLTVPREAERLPYTQKGQFSCVVSLETVGAHCVRPRTAGDGCPYGFYRECRGQLQCHGRRNASPTDSVGGADWAGGAAGG